MASEDVDSHSRVFISHHSSKADIARHLKDALRHEGIFGWMAPDDIGPGEAFDEAIVNQIERSDAVILLLCKRSDQSRHVKRELMIGEDNKCPIFPFRLEDIAAQGLAYWLQDYQWRDVFDLSDQNIGKIATEIRQQIDLREKHDGTDQPTYFKASDVEGDRMAANGAAKRSWFWSIWVKGIIILALVGVILLFWHQSRSGADEIGLEQGNWEFEIVYDGLDMPDASPLIAQGMSFLLSDHNMNHTVCLSREKAADPRLEMIRMLGRGETGYDCRITESGFQNGEIKLRGLCENPEFDVDELSRVSIDGTYTPTLLESDLTVNAQHPSHGRIDLTGRVSMRRVGNCG